MKEESKLFEYLLSPFIDDEETIKVKEFVNRVKKLDDFKDLDLYVVNCCETPTLKKKLKLVKAPERIFTKALSLVNAVTSSVSPFCNTGVYLPRFNKIFVFIDNVIRYGKFDVRVDLEKRKLALKKNFNYSNYACSCILRTLYHEKKHYLQDTNKNNSFSSIMCQIEAGIKMLPYGLINYRLNHDGWYMEIDANNYGTDKAREYFIKNPQDSTCDWDYLDYCAELYDMQNKCYDFDSFFTAYNVCREKIPFYSVVEKGLASFFSKNKGRLWHKVLYGDKKRLRGVEQIVTDSQLDQLDPLFVNYVLTSRYLNNHIDYTKLSSKVAKRLYSEFLNRYRRIISDVFLSVNVDLVPVKVLKRMKKELLYCYQKMGYLNRKVLNNAETLEMCDLDYFDFIIDSKRR